MVQTTDRAACIFGNDISRRDYARACKGKAKFARRFGDDSAEAVPLAATPAPAIGERLGVSRLVPAEGGTPAAPFAFPADESPVVVGMIRMGFGHYRIAMALASAAHALGHTPYWMDLMGFPDTTASKVIGAQNDLYSLGSRLSQRFSLFNKLYWEPLNSEGFRKLSYNAGDQKTAELLTAPLRDLPLDVPFIAAHAWPAQAAVHAGFTRVVNAIPDNWPMALHLAEGAIHTVQTPSSYLGYKMLRGFDGKRTLRPMPAGSLHLTGHYIDHEIVSNVPADTARRDARLERGEPVRYLVCVGGAGAQGELIAGLIEHLLPSVAADRATLMINVGDHEDVWERLVANIPQLANAQLHFGDFGEAARWADAALDGPVSGIHAFCDADIFGAVYSTNLLMRATDVLVTKPSELAYYPVPKLMIRRVGGHEAWGAIRAAELGDGTYEMETLPEICAMIDCLQAEPELIAMMDANIRAEQARGTYDGAYRAVKLATA